MSLERDLMDLDETLMRNDDCVHHSDHITIFLLANDAREIEQLVRDMHTCIDRDCKCDGCPLDGDERCDFEMRMDALGVGVQ